MKYLAPRSQRKQTGTGRGPGKGFISRIYLPSAFPRLSFQFFSFPIIFIQAPVQKIRHFTQNFCLLYWSPASFIHPFSHLPIHAAIHPGITHPPSHPTIQPGSA